MPAAEMTTALGFDAAALVTAWATDWSSGDYPRYRSHYVADFHSRAHATTREWERERRERLAKPGIHVDVREITVAALPDGRMLTSFIQNYAARGYSDTVSKQLLWEHGADTWRIVGEPRTD